MKLRNITIIFTVFLLIVMGVLYYDFNNASKCCIDIAKINSDCKNISARLDDSLTDVASLEKEYDCKIIFRGDSNYVSTLNSAIKNNDTVIDYEQGNEILGKFIFKGNADNANTLIQKQNKKIFVYAIIFIVFLYAFAFVIYISYIKPFKRLKNFSANIAKGNLDFPLPINKNNYFGNFTESFDIMREELIKARENEQLANQSKKELVAELSHDMKTPIATIKATCEVAKVKLDKADKSPDILEETKAKIDIIEQKADTIDQLISNMFHASLEELQVLQVEPAETLSSVIKNIFKDVNFYNKIHLINEVPECLIYMDPLRFEQVVDNIINNSYKYADTDIDCTFTLEENKLIIEIRDHGPGVPENELPLLTEKFYRGTNKTGKTGSGLGLYLASYFMENMRGGMEYYNDNGFVVKLLLSKVV